MSISGRIKFFVSSAFIIITFLLILSITDCQAYAMGAESLDSSVIWGQVIDSVTGQPIEDATVAVWEFEAPIRRRIFTEPVSTLKAITKTAINGSYKIIVEGGFSCRVYAYYDDPYSPGYDYLPKLQSFNLEKGVEVNTLFKMVPAASVIFEGEILFVDSSNPPESYGFTIILGEELPDISGCILTYGTTSDSHSYFINVNQTQVIIPANTSLKIEVKDQTDHTFVIDDPQFSYLERGEVVRIKVEQYSLAYNLNLTKDFIRLVETHVNETEQKGFYVLAEKQDFEKISFLIENAEEMLVGGFYEECYADLREAYTKATYIDGKVQFMYVDAEASTTIIFIFLALTSTAISYLLSEHWAKKALVTVLFCVFFFVILFYVYAGFSVVDTYSLLKIAGVSILASFLIAFILPRLFPMTVTIVFSMAKRNLRGRRIRFILTLITVTAMVMSFVTLTSFSMEYGFTSTTVGNLKLESEGLLIRQPLPEIPTLTAVTQKVVTFTPFETSVVGWLQTKPEVTLVAPKVENWPTRSPLGTLSTPVQSLSIFGVLGLSPSAEIETTGFNKLLVEGEGRYLNDDEENAILISVQAAEALKVKVGEHLVLHEGGTSIEMKLVGLLNDDGLSHITDFDGSPMIPEKLIIIVEEGTVIEARIDSCKPSEVIVTNWQTALKLSSSIYLSSIDAIVESSVNLTPFARQIALERDYWVWIAVNEQINLVGFMSYLEAKGVSIFVPWIIVILNVVVTMINAIYERRREVAILSSVGFNPTHITSLFGAEALIIGIIGGGIGYFMGLSLYKIMPLLSIDLVVRQKISAVWCLASLGIAVTAVLVGAFTALKSSVIITPSLLRRWKAEENSSMQEPRIFEIPVRVSEEDIASLLDYVRKRLQSYSGEEDVQIDRIKQEEKETPESVQKSINFIYRKGSGVLALLIRNKIIASKGKEDKIYTLRLICDAGQEDQVYKTASFVRKLFLEWRVRVKNNNKVDEMRD